MIMFMRGRLPQAMKKPSGEYYWEMHYLRWPKELDGYHPTWVSAPFLSTAEVIKSPTGAIGDNQGAVIRIGAAEFSALIVDVRWLALEALTSIIRLAEEGAMIFVPTRPSEPGRVRHDRYYELLEKLFSLRRVYTGPNALSAQILGRHLPPRIRALDQNSLPLYRIRRTDKTHLCFFAHPGARGLTYPLPYGYAQHLSQIARQVEFRLDPPAGLGSSGQQRYLTLPLDFAPNQSLLIEIDTATAIADWRFLEISYTPCN
jgi:hypothetical protein